MRLLYVSSGKKTLSDLNPSIVSALKSLQEKENFQLETYFSDLEPLSRLKEKLDDFQPQIAVIFGHDAHPIHHYLKQYQIPIGLWVVNDPYSLSNYDDKVSEYGFMITQEESTVNYYKEKRNKPTLHVPLAVNPSNYFPMNDDYEYDICFIGNGWPTRRIFFDQLLPHLKGKRIVIIGRKWNKLKNYRKMKKYIKNKIVEPIQAAKIYNKTKIILNIHRDANDVNKNFENLPALTPNNRTFDIAACQAFQLTTFREGLTDFYSLEDEIVSYKTMEELVEKVEYYLENDELREQMAKKAYEKTLKTHTYEKRMKDFIVQLKRLYEEYATKNNRNGYNSKAICILGMHRSGTSMVSRALNLLGVYIGENDKLIKPGQYNPEGFWEHKQITKTQQKLLETIGASWDQETPLPEQWSETKETNEFKNQILTLVEKDFSGNKLWGWKDPRTSILLPIWHDIFKRLKIETSYIIVVRNPLDVAASLYSRNRISKRKALNMWTLYTLSACIHSENERRALLMYETLLSHHWEESMKNAALLIDVPWPEDVASYKSKMTSFIRPDLQHSQSTLDDILNDEEVPDYVKKTYDLMLQANENKSFLYSQPFKDKVRTYYQLYLDEVTLVRGEQ